MLLLTGMLQTGCRENTLVKAGISPTDNTIEVRDTTLDVITHTYFDDSVTTNIYLVGAGIDVYQGVGCISDPFFGKMTGTTYFQVVPANATSDVFNNMTIDSAVLVLPYSGFTYGDTANQTLTQTYQAFFMNDTLTAGASYYAHETRSVDEASPLSDPYTVNLYHLKDSLVVNTVNQAPGLRMKLNLSVLTNRLLPALDAAKNNTAAALSSFNSIFKGICVRVADSNVTTGAYPYFRLNGSTDYTSGGILVYYHSNSGTTDTLSQRYFFSGDSCGFFNNIVRSYGSAPVNDLLASTMANDSVVGLQDQPGPSIDIIIPGLKSLPSRIINTAQLELSVLPGKKDSKFQQPTRIYAKGVGNGTYPLGTNAGETYYVADQYPITSTTPFTILDGTMHERDKNGTTVETYTIGLPREVMSSITAGNDTLHLRINGTKDFYGAYRLLAGGGNHPDTTYRAKLFVVYSTLK